MAIITNWSKPLEDVLLKKLHNPGMSFHEYRDLRSQCRLLEGAPVSELFMQKLEENDRMWDQKYQTALETARQSSDLSEIRVSLNALKPFSGYRDADRICYEAEKRLAILLKEENDRRAADKKKKEARDLLRKRVIRVVLIAAIAILAVLMAISIRDREQKKQRFIAELEQIRSEAAAGRQDDAIEALKALPQEDLDHFNSDDPDLLYAISQAMLEKAVRDNGYQAGFELYDRLTAEVPKMVSKVDFEEFMVRQLSDDSLSPAEKWEWMLAYGERGISVSSETREAILSEYVASLPAGEAWTVAADAVENDILAKRDDLVRNAYSAVQTSSPASEAWDAAQRAVALDIISNEDETYKSAFQKYVDSLAPFEAWSAIASQYGTSLVDTSGIFDAFEKYSALASVEEAAEMLRTMITVGDGGFAGLKLAFNGYAPYIAQEVKADIQTRYLNAIADELAAGTDRNIPKWADEWSDAMAILPAEPNAALRLVYALHDAGYDVYQLFPKGICLDIPMAERVCNLMDRGFGTPKSGDYPDFEKVLPVSLVQLPESILEHGEKSEKMVKEAVEGIQRTDYYYNTCLSTEQFFNLHEEIRPATYEECRALLCMHTIYWMDGIICTERTNRSNISFSYLPAYYAVGLVAVYSLDDVSSSVAIYAKTYEPKVNDSEWFTINKATNIVCDVENRVGKVDLFSLKRNFQTCVEKADMLPVYILLSAYEYSEEEANDAD